MKTLSKSRYFFLLAPLLMAVFPFLSFYLNNISELSLKFLEHSLPPALMITLLTTVFLYLLLKNKNRAALVTTLSLFIFFTYGHVSRYLDDKLFIRISDNFILGPDKILLPLVFLVYLYTVYRILKTKNRLTDPVVYITVTLLFTVVWSAVQIGLKERQKSPVFPVTAARVVSDTGPAGGSRPDIYDIILDGYARQDILSAIYGYDNSGFIDSLRQMGFFVADKARSNYMHTYISLPSTLNMMYLDDLTRKYGTDPADTSAAMDLLFRNRVTEKLKAYGYRTISFQSWWSGTNENYPADVVYRYEKNYRIAGISLVTDETNMVFLQTTLLNPLIKEVRNDVYRGRILTAFEKLPDIPYLDGLKFTLAHITAPHPPYIFTADGGTVPGSQLESADEGVDKRDKYLGQLKFVSDRILPVITKILKNSKSPPVIFLHSDHGPASTFGRREDWEKNFTPEGIAERSSILFAVYFPDGNYSDLYQDITPVNAYRIIFDKYFGENLDLLPDRVYYTDPYSMYKFSDVTGM